MILMKIEPILIPQEKKKKTEIKPVKEKKPTVKPPVEEKKTAEIQKEEEEWKKGPAPSTKAPPEQQYAFEPTPEERDLMKELQSEKRKKEMLKPTPEEEKIMEEVREPSLTKEFQPTQEEWVYMKREGW